jgi:hypothetical protein
VASVLGQEEFLSTLGKHRMGKGCLYVRKLSDVDLKVLEQLIVGTIAERERRYGQSQSGAKPVGGGRSAPRWRYGSRLFGNTPESWLNAQRAVDLWDAAQAIRSDVERVKPLSAANKRKSR